MKKMKKILLIGLIILPILLIGCGNKPKVSADESAKILFNVLIKGDKSNLEKIKISKDTVDEVVEMQRKGTNTITKNMFAVLGLEITDKQLDEIYNARVQALKKTTVTTEEIFKTDESAQVKVKTTYFNTIIIDQKAANDANVEVEKLNIKDDNKLKTKFIELYVKNLVEGFNNAKPSSDTKEIIVKFKNEKGIWIAEDMGDFGAKIATIVLGVEI